MKKRFVTSVAVMTLLLRSVAAQFAQSPFTSSESETREIVIDRIDMQHTHIGIVVGIIGPMGRRVVAYGSIAVDTQHANAGILVGIIGPSGRRVAACGSMAIDGKRSGWQRGV